MITFNGTDLSDYMRINTIDRGGILPPREVETLEIPQKVGAYLFNVKTGVRLINVGVTIIGVTYEEIQKRKEIIADILRTDEPGSIVFDDEPDRTYYGIVSGGTALDEQNHVGKGSIQFLCPDPYKYGSEETIQIPNGSLAFQNGTNSDIFPRYTATFNKAATFLSVMSANDQITVGQPAQVGQAVIPREELILTENFDSLTGWTAANTVVDEGTVGGTIAVQNGNFVPTAFGTGESWHGPALIKTLPAALTDFKMEVYLENKSTGTKGSAPRASQLGRVEIYLLDVNNRTIAKFAMKDPTQYMERNYGEVRLGALSGGLPLMGYAGDGTVWNEFDGRIYVTRIKDRWEITVGKYDSKTKRHHARLTVGHFDADKKFNQQVAKIQVHFASHSTYPATQMLLDTMRVWKINNVPAATSVPYIVGAGDVVEIETATGGIYRNGVPWMSEFNPTSEFFPLKPGTTQLAFLPNDAATVAMTYRKRWL